MLGNTDLSQGENIETVVTGILRGAVTWHMSDSPEKGEVQISIVTTPKLMRTLKSRSATEVQCEKLEEGIEYVLGKIKKQVMPPTGSNFVTSQDGRFAFIGYGSGLKRKNVNARLQQKLAAMGAKQARMRALRALLAGITGETLTSEDRMTSDFHESIKQFDEVLDEKGDSKIEPKMEEEYRAIARTSMSEHIESVAKGAIPPGVIIRDYSNANWVWSVALYSPEVTAEARKLAKEMLAGPLSLGGTRRTQSYLVEPDGTMRRTADGRLIPGSLGDGKVADGKDIGVKKKKNDK